MQGILEISSFLVTKIHPLLLKKMDIISFLMQGIFGLVHF